VAQELKTSNPRVSIGIPVYNGENYLRDALDSLLRQTFTDLEIVIADNASTDQTQQICASYASTDPRVRYFRNDSNLGPGPNYNRVFRLARGEYFKWAAHDDTYAPDYLEKCVQALDHDPGLVLCHSKTRFIDANGNIIGEYREKLRSDSPDIQVRFRDLIMNVKCFEIFGVIRSSALKETPLHGSFGHADGVLLARLGLMGRFHEIPEYLFLNRDHPDKSIYKYSTYRDYAVFYDPTNAAKILFPRWRMGYEYVKAVMEVPLDWPTRLRCLLQLTHWVRVFWISLLANIVSGVVQVLRRLIPARSGVEKRV
jgi:glycosyltransferase involved in cell wall biosynthesis